MTNSHTRLEELRGLLYNPIDEANTAAIAELLDGWPADDPSGHQIAEELTRETIERWSLSLERNRDTLLRSFPQWLGAPRKVSVRLCGGDTERRMPDADDEYVDALYYGVPERFDAVRIDQRRARQPDPNEDPDGVIWLIAPPRPGGR